MRSDFEEFRRLVAFPGEAFHPVEAAFRIAFDECPELSAKQCAKRRDVIAQVEHFNKRFFEKWRFHGNHDDSYDPRNRF